MLPLLASGLLLLAFTVFSLLPRPGPRRVVRIEERRQPEVAPRVVPPREFPAERQASPEPDAAVDARLIPPSPPGPPRPETPTPEESPSPVVISEIHYDPADGSAEFIELHNPGTGSVSLAGWSLREGIDVELGEDDVLAPGAFLVIRGDRFDGLLSDGGERIALLDGEGRLADEVDYSDGLPFDPRAAGHGPSLERVCASAPGSLPENWRASATDGGTPGAAGAPEVCPPPEIPVRSPVVINEIHYHPPGEGPQAEAEEFVELFNRSDAEVDLHGWSLADGVRHRFARGAGPTTIEPGGFLLVARDPDRVATVTGVARERVAGPYSGKLSNRDDRVALVDASGVEVDAVAYADEGDWPARADGLGSSLQRISADVAGCLPRNWGVTVTEREEQRDLVLVDVGSPVRWAESVDGSPPPIDDRVPFFHPDFDDRRNGWRDGRLAVGYDVTNIGSQGWILTRATMRRGLHSILVRIPFQVPSDTGERIVPKLLMDWDDGFIAWLNGVEIARRGIDLPPGTPPQWNGNYIGALNEAGGDQSPVPAYQRIWTGSPGDLRPGRNVLVIGSFNTSSRSTDLFASARVVLSRTASDADFSPGAPSSNAAAAPPPRVAFLERVPREPRSSDTVTVRARVFGDDVASVELHVGGETGAAEERIAMRRTSTHGPREAIWEGAVPPRRDLSVVRFRIVATSASGGSGSYPHATDPVPQAGYYVVDAPPRANEDLDAFHMIWEGPLSCASGAWRERCTFVHEGTAYLDVRFKYRGDTSCGRPKTGLRVAFNKGALFRGQSRLNLLACWEDRAMLREKIAWDLFRDIGHPYCEAKHAVVHGAGNRFHGLFIALEDPGGQYLRRNGLDTDGSLWKCRNSLRGSAGGGFEKRAGEENGEDWRTISELARQLNNLRGQELIEFILENVDVESMIEYQTVKCLISDEDGFSKNWLLYHGTIEDDSGGVIHRWAPHAWDLDLSFGQIDLGSDRVYTRKHPLVGTRDHPRHGSSWNGFLEAVFGRETGDYFVKALYGRIWRMLEEKLHPDVILPEIDRLDANTNAEARQDMRRWPRWGVEYNNADFHRDRLRDYVRARWEHLRRLLLRSEDTSRTTASGAVVETRGGTRRVFYGDGAMRQFRYTPAPRLKITEIHFDPEEDSRLEFIEIRNLEKTEVDLSGWSIPAVDHVFPAGSTAPPDALIIVARDPAAFEARYGDRPDLPVFGPFPGRLSNSGEDIRLRDSGLHDGRRYYPETIDVVKYRSTPPWPPLDSSHGRSLELRDLTADNDLGVNWRFSAGRGGSPGQ